MIAEESLAESIDEKTEGEENSSQLRRWQVL